MTNINKSNKYFAIIPAAGSGQRMQANTPKAYLPLLHHTIIETTVMQFVEHSFIERCVVVIAPEDEQRWSQLVIAQHPKILKTYGGKERLHSVLNGLKALAHEAQADDWVMVHDVARPCITQDDINRLCTELNDANSGGILAIPVRDTLKRGFAFDVEETIPRDHLWLAQTPQMFRYQLLQQALQQAVQDNMAITDEAMAVERLGEQVKLVMGNIKNIKITYPEDLELAELYLRACALSR